MAGFNAYPLTTEMNRGRMRLLASGGWRNGRAGELLAALTCGRTINCS